MVDNSSDAPPTLLSCRVCQKTFGRHEHLKRHELTHNDPKYQCSSCSKCFVRKDGLERHEAVHRSTLSLVHKKARACLTCASAKARCSGDRPACQRCSRKAWACTYPAADEQQAELEDRQQQNLSQQQQQSPEDERNSTHDSGHQLVAPQTPCSTSEILSYRNDLIAPETQQPLSVANWTQEMEGYLHDWDNGELNINWLPLNYVEFDINDPNVQFPFQQPSDMGVIMDDPRGHLMSSPGNGGCDTSMHRAALGGLNSTMADSAPQRVVSTSPASVLNPGSNSPLPISPAQTTTSGEFYVDGNGARLPRVKRRRLTSMSTPRSTTAQGLYLSFPPSLNLRDPQAAHIGIHQYSQLQHLYQRLCLMSNFFRPFSETEFLSREAISNLIDSFLADVHPWFPITHIPTFDMSRLDTVLIIAMAALGARQLQVDDSEALSTALFEFIRRVFLDFAENYDAPRPSAETLVLSQFWYAVGAIFSGVKTLQESGSETLKTIAYADLFELSRKRQMRPSNVSVLNDEEWRIWSRSEEFARLQFSIWLLDSTISAENGTVPILSLTSISHLMLPSHEAIWTADSIMSVQQLSVRFQSPSDVSTVMQGLYVSKELPPDLGEFAQLIITHGVIKLTREMRPHLRHNLSEFVPSAEKRPAISAGAQNDNRRRTQEVYQRWRNAACDSIDVLHWRANAMIGGASGMEHPGVMHLHFTRVVLLAPLQEIIALANQLSHPDRSGFTSHGISLQARQQPIRQWVLEDPYKARLAAIHAGVLFWHVRRYSSSAFYEPGAVALSTLMLWALSAFSVRAPRTAAEQNAEPMIAGSVSEGSHRSFVTEPPPVDTCEIILIDRPTDDVLVQQFVRQGQNMQAIMTGVGNLFGPMGAQRILRAGYKLIASLDSWRYHARYWLDLLKALDVATSSTSLDSGAMASNGVANGRR